MFDATHARILRWVADDGIDGLRVDHPDGFADPRGYLRWLRDTGPRRVDHGREDHRARRGAAADLAGAMARPATTRSPRSTPLFVDPAAEATFTRAVPGAHR